MTEEDRTIVFKIVFSNRVSLKTKKLIDHLLVETIDNNLKRRDFKMTISYTEELK